MTTRTVVASSPLSASSYCVCAQINIMAAINVIYGPTLSPPRLRQLQQVVKEYIVTSTAYDPWFLLHVPDLCRYTHSHIDMHNEDAPAVSRLLITCKYMLLLLACALSHTGRKRFFYVRHLCDKEQRQHRNCSSTAEKA